MRLFLIFAGEAEQLRIRIERRLIGIPRERGADLAAERLPLGDEQLLERGAERVVAGADVDGRTLAELLERGGRQHLALQRVGWIRTPHVAVVRERRDLWRASRRRDQHDMVGD